MKRRPYLYRLFDLGSQAFNTAALNGEPDESFSGRSYRRNWWTARWINALFFWQSNHCRGAYHADLHRARARLAQHERDHAAGRLG